MEQDAAASQPGSEAFASAHRRLLADDSIQFDLPQWSVPKPPAWLEPLQDLLETIAPFFIYIFWGAVILGAAIILAVIFMELRGVAWRMPWQKDVAEETEQENWLPDRAVAEILLSEADALAASGRYDEAVHLLLHRSVADIAQRLPDFLRPSFTARDIAGSDALPALPRAAFDQMRIIVESGVFAQRPVDAGQWQEARQAYGRFAFREAWA